MSLLKITNENKKAIIVVGKSSKKTTSKAMTFLSNNPIVYYANEYDIEDNYSIPLDRGILILESNYKPNVDLIKKTILQYRGQVVLTSENQKDVPKTIFNLCQLRRATGKDNMEEIAPRAVAPMNYNMDIYTLVLEYLRNPNRDEVATLLKEIRPPDMQFISWLTPNLHPNRLIFVDYNVKRRWDSDYFYEILAYSHTGRMERRIEMPKRGKYSQIPRISKRLGLSPSEYHLLDVLLKDSTFKEHAKKQLTNSDCRLLKLGEKRKKKRTDLIIPQTGLLDW
tara:strand:- start:15994 stop:16836 length:843 start_codon:yes stop_codon:yes gene_type:complete